MKRFLERLCVFDALMTQNYPSLKKGSITMIKKVESNSYLSSICQVYVWKRMVVKIMCVEFR